MHTDEFEISLLREIDNCAFNLKRLNKIISVMERRYGMSTNDFIRDCSNNLPEGNHDFKIWFDTVESLRRWQNLYDEYMKLYKMMKI